MCFRRIDGQKSIWKTISERRKMGWTSNQKQLMGNNNYSEGMIQGIGT